MINSWCCSLLLLLLVFLFCLISTLICWLFFSTFFTESRPKVKLQDGFCLRLLPSGLPSPIDVCLFHIPRILSPLSTPQPGLCFSLLVLFSPSSLAVTVAASLTPPPSPPVFSRHSLVDKVVDWWWHGCDVRQRRPFGAADSVVMDEWRSCFDTRCHRVKQPSLCSSVNFKSS